ncbi:MAG TPA: hypothetical protein DCX06_05675 [Opitutae bacterium]|nr:hypothetical protein [Opitutae bacterium]
MHMIYKLCSIALLLIFTASLEASTLTWDQTEARIELKPNEEEARATFTVTNNGDKAVRIARIKTSCGCTGSIVERKIIEPGQSTEIVGTFHKGKRQGLNHNKLQVFLDNQADAVATLHMIVQVPNLIELQPRIIYWNADSAKTERKVRVSLDPRYVNEITEISYNRKTLDLVDTEDPTDSSKRVIQITPKSFSHVLRETIVIKAKGENGQSAESRLHVFVQP